MNSLQKAILMYLAPRFLIMIGLFVLLIYALETEMNLITTLFLLLTMAFISILSVIYYEKHVMEKVSLGIPTTLFIFDNGKFLNYDTVVKKWEEIPLNYTPKSDDIIISAEKFAPYFRYRERQITKKMRIYSYKLELMYPIEYKNTVVKELIVCSYDTFEEIFQRYPDVELFLSGAIISVSSAVIIGIPINLRKLKTKKKRFSRKEELGELVMYAPSMSKLNGLFLLKGDSDAIIYSGILAMINNIHIQYKEKLEILEKRKEALENVLNKAKSLIVESTSDRIDLDKISKFMKPSRVSSFNWKTVAIYSGIAIAGLIFGILFGKGLIELFTRLW